MNKRWLIILLGVLGLFMLYEILNNSFSLLMLMIGVLALVFRNYMAKKNRNILLIVGIGAFLLALFSSRVVLLILVVIFMLLIGEYPKLFQTFRQAISKQNDGNQNNEFIMVDFAETNQKSAKVVRNRWFGDNRETADEIYSWDDINFTKVMGDTIFDLGNTILPKEKNIILIRKGLGQTRILVPEEVAISLDVSMLLGEVTIDQEEVFLKNETFKWQSKHYGSKERKIKLVANVLVGEVEVVFL